MKEEQEIAIDLETGGFEDQADTHALLSIAAVPFWDAAPFYILVQPDGLIDAKAAEVNGYTPEAWADAVPIKHALIAFQQWLAETGVPLENITPVAHNAGFDRLWLRHRQRREGIDLGLTHRWQCSQNTMGLCRSLGLIQAESTSLDALAAAFDLQRPEPHNALIDARVCRDGYLRLTGLLASMHQQLTNIKDYLWPNQTGLPNRHRDALICIQQREQLARQRLADLEAELEQLKKERGHAA